MLMVSAWLAPVTSRVGKMDPAALVSGRARPIISRRVRDSVNTSNISCGKNGMRSRLACKEM